MTKTLLYINVPVKFWRLDPCKLSISAYTISWAVRETGHAAPQRLPLQLRPGLPHRKITEGPDQ